jgi:hypothetical protein
MLQNSQSKGQPREYWILIEEYLFILISDQSGTGVSVIEGRSGEE